MMVIRYIRAHDHPYEVGHYNKETWSPIAIFDNPESAGLFLSWLNGNSQIAGDNIVRHHGGHWVGQKD